MKSIISVFIFLIAICQSYAGDGIRLISSDLNSAVIEFIPSYDTSIIKINNQQFIRVSFFDGCLPEPYIPGTPELLMKKLNIGVPSEYGNTIQMLSSEYKDIKGNVCPVPGIQMKNGLTYTTYEINEKYTTSQNNDLISFGDYGLSRGLPLQTINISPVQFDYTNHDIRLYTRILFRINFAVIKQSTDISYEDDLLREGIINYNIAKRWFKKDIKLKKETRNSVLSSGKWYTFEAPEEGIYKIDRQMLLKLGIDPASVDPATIKIYNNGGKDLPENITAARPEDLQENAIYVYGEDDGKFDEGDYILFYGRGINFWETDSSGAVKRHYHTFSTKNLYWITSGGSSGKRMEMRSSVSTVPGFSQTTTKAYRNWEEDKSKILQSGKLYLGDVYGRNSYKTYMTKLEGLIPGSQIEYKINLASRSETTAYFTIKEHDTEILRAAIPGVGIGKLDDAMAYSGYPFTGIARYNGELINNESLLKFNYIPSGESSIGYLNYFEIKYDMSLKASEGQLIFYNQANTGIIQYDLSGFPSSNIKVFDITDYANVKLIIGEYLSGGDCSFKLNEATWKKYFAVENVHYKFPINIKEAANSNLHGITNGAKFIIITPKLFKDQAERLKKHKENDIKLKISTILVDIDEIYAEFSGGITDVCAIRDFLKYAYENWQIKPEYVLLFGDGDYDYKNTEGKGNNFIIPYESNESFHKVYTYASDDFYSRINGDDQIADIAIGRLNILSADDAKALVDKIIKYETRRDFGSWRNLITIVGDDNISAGGSDEGSIHTGQCEMLSRYIPSCYDQQKIYLALYPTIETATGRRKPAVDKAIIEAINQGTLIMDYTGHGNYEVWSHESVFQNGVTIPQLNNENYFFLSAATCSFGEYDRPGFDSQSATELMLVKPESGTIGTLAACREVEPGPNADLNNLFFYYLLKKDSSNQLNPIGKSYLLTKLTKYQLNDMKFHLFCDPTLRLAVPEIQVQIDSIDGSSGEVQVKALSTLKIKGSVRNNNGSVESNYNGEALISVYDSERKIIIKEMNNYEVSLQGGIIYKGALSIINGKFSTEFTVPKDLSYENKTGKITVYIYNENSDGIGYSKNIIVGGTDSTKNDGKGPNIDIGFDDDYSGNSYLVTPEFELNVKLKDQTGLNTTGTGIGHKLEGILNADDKSPIDFTNYFVGDLNSGGKSGVIKYRFNGIEQGNYNIQVKAWDVFNNFSTGEKSFTVVTGDDIVLRDVYNYPNPFAGNTTFTLQHNIAEPVDVKINVYTVTGRKIKVIEEYNINDKFVRIDWDGRDEEGNLIANGTYLYKVIVSTAEKRFKQELIGKLAVVR